MRGDFVGDFLCRDLESGFDDVLVGVGGISGNGIVLGRFKPRDRRREGVLGDSGM